jgi:hypothetical protein
MFNNIVGHQGGLCGFMVSDYSPFAIDYSQHFLTHRIRQIISTPPQRDINNFTSFTLLPSLPLPYTVS